MSDTPTKVFLSYGRADASALADRLAHDLAHHEVAGKRRYVPWKDRVALVAGSSWADQIAAALRDTAAVIAIMSPHSVRSRVDGRSTEDSVCLDEIAFARFGARKPIVPVLAAPCTPPFEIFRLDYVDFTQWQKGGVRARVRALGRCAGSGAPGRDPLPLVVRSLAAVGLRQLSREQARRIRRPQVAFYSTQGSARG
jgi:hypothetical protein